MEIVERMSEYTIKNETKIAGLKTAERIAFKSDFMDIWKGYGKLLGQVDLLPRNMQSQAMALKNDYLLTAYYSINRELRPEIHGPQLK